MNFENIQLSLFGFLLSISLGSFYITLAYRILELFYGKRRKHYTSLQKFKVLFTEPSHCDHCQKPIPILYLTPVFGSLLAKQKCVYCKFKVHPIYSWTEFIFGGMFLLIYFLSNQFLYSLITLVFFGHLLISILTDHYKFSLDYENLLFIVFFGILSNYLLTKEWLFIYDLYVLACFFLFYVVIWFLYKRGMGLGDVLFAPFYAMLCGHPWWILFLNSSYILAVAITLVMKKDKNIKNYPIPMGVYFGIGTIISYIAKLIYFKFGQ